MMTRSRLFDNIMQVIATEGAIAGTDIISSEMDLELPRGFVAKIHKVLVQMGNWESVLAATETDHFSWALLLDPDDAVTTEMPNDTVEHDVVVSDTFNLANITVEATVPRQELQYDFSHLEGLDILSARNLRFNITAAGTALNGVNIKCIVYYTLEVIKDAQIMELLDIL